MLSMMMFAIAVLMLVVPAASFAGPADALSTIEGKVTITNNQAENITTVSGGSGSFAGVKVGVGSSDPVTTVNGVTQSRGAIGGDVTISGNSARNVTNVGGTVTVNGVTQR